jgi:hypothetical protein
MAASPFSLSLGERNRALALSRVLAGVDGLSAQHLHAARLERLHDSADAGWGCRYVQRTHELAGTQHEAMQQLATALRTAAAAADEWCRRWAPEAPGLAASSEKPDE